MKGPAHTFEAVRNAYCTTVGKRLRYLRWKLFRRWGHLGRKVRFYGGGQSVTMPWKIYIGDNVALGKGVVLRAGGRIEIRGSAYIGEYCVLECGEAITIGEWTMMGSHVVVIDGDHGTENADKPMMLQPMAAAPITIGRDCWIGANATILKGVTIGDGAVIGAGAVVTKDIPRGAVAVGVPARVLRYREGFEPGRTPQQA